MIRTTVLKSFLPIGSLILFLSGCGKFSTDPTPAFYAVQNEVQERTGECIYWDKSACSDIFHQWLEETLKENLDLGTVIQIALFNNPKIKAYYEELGVRQAQLVQAGLLKNPIFGLSARFEELVKAPNILEMGIVQDFLDLLLKPLKTKRAAHELEFTKLEVTARILDVIAEAKIAYFSLRAAENGLTYTKETLAARDASYDVAKRLRAAGNITELALTAQRSNYEQMKIDVANAQLEVVTAKERLNRVMGLWDLCLSWNLSETDPCITEIEFDFCCMENQVIANSLDLQMARQKMRVTALEYGISKAELIFPEIMIGPDSEKDPAEPWFVGPQISIGIPIFDFGIAKSAEARAELSRQWNDYLALAIEIRSYARLAGFRLLTALHQYQHYQNEVIPLTEKVTHETLIQLNGMQLGVIELLQVKQSEVETKLKSLSTYRDYWIARTEYELLISGRMIPKGKQ